MLWPSISWANGMDFSGIRAAWSLVLLCRTLFFLCLFFWPLYCLSFFDLRLLIVPLYLQTFIHFTFTNRLWQMLKHHSRNTESPQLLKIKHGHTFHLAFTCSCLKIRTHYIYIFTYTIMMNSNWWTFKTLLQSSKCHKNCICISRYGLWCNVIFIISGKRHYHVTCVCLASVYLT